MARAWQLQPVAVDQAVQVVARVLRVQAPRQLYRAQRARLEAQAGALERVAQEAVVEARVVRDEDAPLEPLERPGARSSNAGRVRAPSRW